jgi:hypothetical protein
VEPIKVQTGEEKGARWLKEASIGFTKIMRCPCFLPSERKLKIKKKRARPCTANMQQTLLAKPYVRTIGFHLHKLFSHERGDHYSIRNIVLVTAVETAALRMLEVSEFSILDAIFFAFSREACCSHFG